MPFHRRVSLAPAGLIVERCETELNRLLVHARNASSSAPCAACRASSASLHSHYRRLIHDFPVQGRAVLLSVTAQRLICRTPSSPRRVFAERLSQVVPGLTQGGPAGSISSPITSGSRSAAGPAIASRHGWPSA